MGLSWAESPAPPDVFQEIPVIHMEDVRRGEKESPQIGIIHPPSAITTFSPTEAVPVLRTASATSSAEDVSASMAHMGGFLIPGTARLALTFHHFQLLIHNYIFSSNSASQAPTPTPVCVESV